MLDADAAKDPAARAKVTKMAERAGVNPDQFLNSITTRAEVMAIDLAGGSSFAENINLSPVPTASLPTEKQLTAAIKTFSGAPHTFSRITTPLGAGVQESYTLKAGLHSVQGVMMFVPNGQGALSTIAVSTTSRERATELAGEVARSLRAA